MTARRRPPAPPAVASDRPRKSRRSIAPRRPIRVISGGQTGVDRAALDAGLACGIEIGGWCPRGRKAEDGRIDLRYPLHEADTAHYAERTRLNVRDADATLILASGPLTGGTALTRSLADLRSVPVLIIDQVTESPAGAAARIRAWIETHGIQILNVAGPRESTRPGIYDWSLHTLTLALRE